MVTVDNGNGHRNFYMVASETPEGAVAAVKGQMKSSNAAALAPVSQETLTHFATTPASVFLCFTMEMKTGKVTSNQLGEKGRQYV
jgi:hypothetical protein